MVRPALLRKLTISSAAVVLLGAALLYAWRWQTPREVTINGVVVSLDPVQRIGVLRIVHPKSGEPLEIRGELAPDCVIQINGEPVELSALHPGDSVQAEGLFYRYGRVVARRLSRVSADDEPARSSQGS